MPKASPAERGIRCRCTWGTSCPAASPSEIQKLMPSQPGADGTADAYALAEEPIGGGVVQAGGRGDMRARDHQDMTLHPELPQVHKRQHVLVLGDDAGGHFPREHATEHARLFWIHN